MRVPILRDGFLNKLIYIILLMFAFSIPILSFFSVKILVILLALVLFTYLRNIIVKEFFVYAWDCILYIGIMILGLIFSEDFQSGIRVLETSFSFLAIPVTIFCIKFYDERRMYQLLYAFIIGITVASFICLVSATINFIKTGDVQTFFFYELTGILDLQPTYLAYYLIFSITFALHLLFYKKTEVNPILIALLIVFFFCILMLTGGKTSFISLLFVFSFFILKYFLDKNNIIQKLTVGLVFLMLVLMFAINSFDQENRQVVLNDSWDRFALWESVLAANPNFILGVGTGDYKAVLNAYYEAHHMKDFASTSLNSHNQFLQILFSNGILGLLSVIFLLTRPLYLAFKHDDTLGILVFFPFIIYGMTEVFLGRYQGVVFFAFLHQVFIAYYKSLRPSTFLKGD